MKHKIRNHHLSGKLMYTGKDDTTTHIQLVQYSDNLFLERNISDIRDIHPLINENSVSWIQVSGMNNPDLIVSLMKEFGLSIMDAKDVLTIQHIITVEEYDTSIFIVLPTVYYNNENEEVTEHIALVLGKNYVISFQESNFPLFENINIAIKDNSLKINNKKSDFLLASILNSIMNNYVDCIMQLEDELEELEDELLDFNNLKDDLIGTIQEKRRKMIRLRKLLLPFKDQLIKLLRADESLINKQEIPYFKDIYDQLLYTLQNIESCREIMSSLVDLYLNNNDLKMNVVMKQLTIVATIFIPLTFIVGVWGMNFEFMPELDWRYGYLCAWIFMIACGLVVWWYLKRKKWF